MALKKIIKDLAKTKPDRKFVLTYRILRQRYPSGEDSWGLDLQFLRKIFVKVWPFYRHYFKVRVFGEEHVPEKGAIVATSNHTGQIALDGALVTMAFFSDIKSPRILRPMVERFVYKTPFVGAWVAALGGILGDRRNCMALLKQGEAVLIFPEGVRGIAKSTSEFYQLQPFGLGFFRMALEAECDILPIAVVGAEEFYPYTYQARWLAKRLKLPCFPITANLLPLPSPVDIYIGKPYSVPKDLSKDTSDAAIAKHVRKIEDQIKQMIQEGLEKRRPFALAKRIPGDAERQSN